MSASDASFLLLSGGAKRLLKTRRVRWRRPLWCFDIRFDQEVTVRAKQHEVLDAVAPYQYEAMARIDCRNLDHGEPAFRVPRVPSEGRRYSYATQTETAQHECQQTDKAEDEKQRQNKSDVLNIHE